MESKLKEIVIKLREIAVEHREYDSGYIQACDDIMREIESCERDIKDGKN